MGKLTSPNGDPIIGTSDTIRATATTNGFTRLPSGHIEADYDGTGSQVDWDSQTPRHDERGVMLVLDDSGNEWPIDACTYSEADEEDDDAEV